MDNFAEQIDHGSTAGNDRISKFFAEGFLGIHVFQRRIIPQSHPDIIQFEFQKRLDAWRGKYGCRPCGEDRRHGTIHVIVVPTMFTLPFGRVYAEVPLGWITSI